MIEEKSQGSGDSQRWEPWRRPQYKWPKYVLAGVIIFFVAAIVWVVIEAHKVEHERDFSSPIESH